jgi:hypothetical protein
MAANSRMMQKNIMSINYSNSNRRTLYSVYNNSGSDFRNISVKSSLESNGSTPSSFFDNPFSKMPSLDIVSKIKMPSIDTDKILNEFYDAFFKMGRELNVGRRFRSTKPPVKNSTVETLSTNSTESLSTA